MDIRACIHGYINVWISDLYYGYIHGILVCDLTSILYM